MKQVINMSSAIVMIPTVKVLVDNRDLYTLRYDPEKEMLTFSYYDSDMEAAFSTEVTNVTLDRLSEYWEMHNLHADATQSLESRALADAFSLLSEQAEASFYVPVTLKNVPEYNHGPFETRTQESV